jgi:hypothetical protein
VNCTLTEAGTNFPWNLTATATANVQVHGVDVDVLFENTPGNPTPCPANGARSRFTGTLTSGVWNSAANTMIYTNAPGLTSHSIVPAGASVPMFLTGTIRDTANTLRMFD